MGVRSGTALVLSAGGMFAAWQAGAWEVLSRELSPDVVIGTSAGALNAWLISSDIKPEELSRRWLDLHHAAAIRWRFPAHPLAGILDPKALEAIIREISASHIPRRRLGVVTTQWAGVRPRLFCSPDVDWRHLTASCAVPLVLPQQRLDGQWHADGGVIDTLPLWAAAEMGSERVVALDVLNHTPLLLRALGAPMRRYRKALTSGTENLTRIVIGPSVRLGGLLDSACWSEENTRRWIELGRCDAERALPSVVKYLEQGSLRSPGEQS